MFHYIRKKIRGLARGRHPDARGIPSRITDQAVIERRRERRRLLGWQAELLREAERRGITVEELMEEEKQMETDKDKRYERYTG